MCEECGWIDWRHWIFKWEIQIIDHTSCRPQVICDKQGRERKNIHMKEMLIFIGRKKNWNRWDNCLISLVVFGLAIEISWIWIIESQRIIVVVKIEVGIYLVSIEKRVEGKGLFENDTSLILESFKVHPTFQLPIICIFEILKIFNNMSYKLI